MGGARAFALLAMGASALLVAVESCAVDPYLTCGDACDDGGAADATTDSSSSPDGSPDGSTSCHAKSCDSYPGDCHSALDDGCGGTIDCSNACPAGQSCVVDAGASIPGFFCNGPPVCKDAGAPGGNCGTLTNSANGLVANCGNCVDTGFTCTDNTCGCSGTLCSTGHACCSGVTPDCTSNGTSCCKKKTCATDYPGQCGSALNNGCGSTINCSGSCVAQVCDVDSSLCCTPDSMSTTCNNKCGTVIDNCAVATNCGTCGNNDVCFGSLPCTCGTIMCNPGQQCRFGPDRCL